MNYIKLFHTDLTSDYQNTLDFDSKASQTRYFDGLAIAEFGEENLSVIKELEEVRLYANYNSLQTVNYAYFENDIDGVIKGYYAFVTGVKWCGIGVVGLSLQIDYIQTYLFDYTLKTSFISRAHVNRRNSDGTPDLTYADTPENINIGTDVVYKKVKEYQTSLRGTWSSPRPGAADFRVYYLWIIATNHYGDTAPIKNKSSYGLLGTFYVYMLPFSQLQQNKQFTFKDIDGNNLAAISEVYELIKADLKTVSVFVTAHTQIPIVYNATGLNATMEYSSNHLDSITIDGKRLFMVDYDAQQSMPIDPYPIRFDKEVKASCFPYKHYLISLNRGDGIIAKPQRIKDSEIKVTLKQDISPIPRTTYGITNYEGEGEHGYATDDKNNELPLINNSYLTALQTRKASMTTGIATSVAQTGFSLLTSMATGNYLGAAGAAIGGASNLLNQFAQIEDLRTNPDSIRKSGNNYNIEYMLNTMGMILYEVTLPYDEQQRVLDYFQKFGYSIKRFVDIDLKSRQYFNFIQTVEANITGDFNDTVRIQLKQIFDNGIRFWHVRDGQEFPGIGNYTVENDEVIA